MRRPRSSAPVVLCLVGGLLGFPSLAAAQAPDPQRAAAAQALFDQANEEMEKKRFSTAEPTAPPIAKKRNTMY